MANKARGECEVVLCGTTYTMRPTFDALVKFEDRAGQSAYEAMRCLTESNSAPVKHVAAAFHAGIEAVLGAKAPSYGAIGKMIMETGLVRTLPAYAEFLTNSMSSSEDLAARAEGGGTGEAK